MNIEKYARHSARSSSSNSKFKIQNPKSLHLPPPLSWSNSKPPLSASNSSVMNAQTHSEIGPSLRILTLRSQRVLLDTDLARLYGVETRALNQAVKRNLDRFPSEFAFPLTREEILSISQTVTSLIQLKFSKSVHAFLLISCFNSFPMMLKV